MEKTEHQTPLKFLSSGWEARLGLNGRVYYYSLHSQTVQILPPPESWSCDYNLPYGWELALDYSDKPYFINHVLQRVTYEDPRHDRTFETDSGTTPSDQQPPAPREYTIARHPQLGFGFIAGSEKPVIIRSVSPGGPSETKLLPGDQIIKIGSEYVRNAAREHVIELIRDSIDGVTLTVLQPTRVANSSFLKPNKRLMKGVNRPRVRFADDNGVDGEENMTGSSPLLIVPGTLRVVLEEGQARSFQFSSDTTAGDIVSALCEKLGIVDSKLYSLVLTPSKQAERRGQRRNRTSDEILIAPWDCIAKVVANPSVKHHECRFRLTFVSKDIHKLSRDDPKSFRYHYVQCVNDVVAGDVYGDDLSQDETLRLASFQMLEVFIGQFADEGDENGKSSGQLTKKKSFSAPSKISLKQIEKEYGLARFLSPPILALVNSSQSKEHRKILQQYLKANFAIYVLGNGGGSRASSPPTSPTNERHLSVDGLLLRIRMQYVKILSPHHLYAGRYFDATILAVVESDITLVVGHHYGISQLVNSKTKMASIFADFTCVTSVEVAPCQPVASKTNVRIEFQDMAPLVLAMHPLSAQTFAFMVSGYCRVYDNNDMMLTLPIAESTEELEYFASHKVKVSHWNYPPKDEEDNPDPTSSFFYSDFSEPVRASLLSDQIPLSVRAMYQQSKIPMETEEGPSKMEPEEDSNANQGSPSQLLSRHRLTADDEGVALSHAELSPLSSVSSVNSSSPSSGIGSVTSHQVLAEAVKSGDQSDGVEGEGEWNELMVALYNDDETEKTKDEISTNDESSAKDENEIFREEDSQLDSGDDEHTETDGRVESDEVGEAPKEEKPASSSGGNDPSAGLESNSAPIPLKRNRFSSFKPDETEENKEDESQSTSQSEQARNTLTSDQLKEHLVQSSLSLNQNEEQNEQEEDPQIIGSPLPVSDLARGHKSLKNSRKQKNRRSWFARDSVSRSFSLDTGLNSSPEPPKRNKSFFRNIFSPSHSYSVKSEKSPSSMSLNRDPMPGAKRTSRWRFFRSSETTTPTKKFSFFSFFTRKKSRHTVNISSTDIGSPMANNDGITSGAYSVFSDGEAETGDSADLKRATSVEDVQRRPRDQVSPKPRPVSFMTFQQLPKDFQVTRSPSRRSGSSGNDNMSPKNAQAPFHLPEPKLAIKTVQQQVSTEEDASEEMVNGKDGNNPKNVDRHEYENWGNLTPPVKPARSRKSSEGQSQVSIASTDEDTEQLSADESLKEAKPLKTSIKRKAPPPPKVPPPDIDSPNELSPLTDVESDDGSDDEKVVDKLEPLDLTHLHSDEDITSEEELEDTSATDGGKSNDSQGSLMGEIFAYLKTNGDENQENSKPENISDDSDKEHNAQNLNTEDFEQPPVGGKEPSLADSEENEEVIDLNEGHNRDYDDFQLGDDVMETLSNKSEPKASINIEQDKEDENVNTVRPSQMPEELETKKASTENVKSISPGEMYAEVLDDSESDSDSDSDSVTHTTQLVPTKSVETFGTEEQTYDESKTEMLSDFPNTVMPVPEDNDKNIIDTPRPEKTQTFLASQDVDASENRDEVLSRANGDMYKDGATYTHKYGPGDQVEIGDQVATPRDDFSSASNPIASVYDVTTKHIDNAGFKVPQVKATGVPKVIHAQAEDSSSMTSQNLPPCTTEVPPVVATETVASGNGEIVSTWTFADPEDLPPPPPAEFLEHPNDEIAPLGIPSSVNTPPLPWQKSPSLPWQKSSSLPWQKSPPYKSETSVSNGVGDKSLIDTDRAAAIPLYTSMVTPRLFGQTTKSRGFAKVKPPTAKAKTPQQESAEILSQSQPKRNGVGVTPGSEPTPGVSKISRPPIPPKPGHLYSN